MSVIDRALGIFDEIKVRFEQRRAVFQPRQNRVTSFRNSANSPEKKVIPLFGSDSGFGEDWASYMQPHPKPFGPVPIEHENTHGFAMNAQPLIGPTEEYQDPAISPAHKSGTISTDQRPVGLGHDTSPLDKEVVLYHEPKKSLESSRPKESTIADQIAKEMKNEPYDFLS